MKSRLLALVFAVVVSMSFAASASAATLSVDDDAVQCPAAGYDSVQAAIDAAAPGDTVAICPGTYTEGTGLTGTNALTITKNLTLKGAGADQVTIQPKRSTANGGQIAAASPVLRDAVGNIISISGATAFPINVDISGVTIDGNGVYSEAGVVYLDAGGSLVRSRVNHIVTSEDNASFNQPGGYRSNNLGIGVAQLTGATTAPPGAAPRALLINHTRIEKYNSTGILIDGATGSNTPLTASGIVNNATISSSQVVGRLECINFKADGNCATVGLLTTGPTFGQDGVRITAGSTGALTDNTISQNLVNGTGAPTRNSATNNANLSVGAGVRLQGAGASTATRNNIVDNSYGAFNVTLDGATANTAVPFSAEQNYWGLRTNATANNGPAVSPTTNPPAQENPVNGTATVDATCLNSAGTAGSNSDAVDFCPYRNGSQSDPDSGEYPVAGAPLQVNDAAPTVSLASDKTNYDRGEDVELTATSGDDFGVSKVTYYNGFTPIGTTTPPDDTFEFHIPNNADCASPAYTFTAVAQDSSGQTTASNQVQVNVTGPNNCQTPPNPPGPPTVNLVNPPSTIPQNGTTVNATATADTANGATVASVKFLLGTRLVCTDTTAPYSCAILPNGDEVGSQTLRAIVTDTTDPTPQTDEDDAAVTVSKFDPKALKIYLKKENKSRNRTKWTVNGKIKLPSRVTQAQGCSGTVTGSIDRNGTTLFPSVQVPLKADCSYSFSFTLAKAKSNRFKITETFGGNNVLNQISANRRFSK